MIARHMLLALALLAGCSTPEERQLLSYRLQRVGSGVSQIERGIEPNPHPPAPVLSKQVQCIEHALGVVCR